MLPAEVLDRYDDRSILLCYPEGEADDDVADAVASWHRDLVAAEDNWALGPPEFIDEVHEGDRTIGVVIRLLPPVDRDGVPSPIAVDRQMLVDVERLVASGSKFTAEEDFELALELDGLVVGWIEAGAPLIVT